MSRCIFCGYCELACPFDAITLGNEFEISEYSRDDLIYTKDMLLARADQDGARSPTASSTTRRSRTTRTTRDRRDASATSSSGSSGSSPRSPASAPGIAVVSFSNPFYSALALIGNLGSLAVLYLLLSAEFVAAAQVLVYAGAVMVMFLFVIAYLGGRADAPWAGGPSWQAIAAVARRGRAPRRGDRRDRPRRRAAASRTRPTIGRRRSAARREIGRLFLTDHLLAFEITSIVLLVAAVGGVILGSHARGRADGGGEPMLTGPDIAWYLGRRRRSCSRPARSACCSAAAR